jgi:hypothetical protein
MATREILSVSRTSEDSDQWDKNRVALKCTTHNFLLHFSPVLGRDVDVYNLLTRRKL